MKCEKCRGLVVNDYGEVRCMNCGARPFEILREPDGSYRPTLPVAESAQPAKTVEVETNGSEKKAVEVLGKMKKATAASPSIPATPPPAPSADLDAAWLSEVLDCEDFLRGSQQGKGILRSIREGFKLADGAYPLLPEEQQQYKEMLISAVKRMQAK